MNKYTGMFEGLYPKSRSSIFAIDLYYMRRYTLVILLIFAGQYNGIIQTIVYLFCNSMVMFHMIRYRPHDSILRNTQAMLHEGTCFAFTYYLLGFTDAIPFAHARYNYGWAPIALLLVYTVASSIILLKEHFRLLKLKTMNYCLYCKYMCL